MKLALVLASCLALVACEKKKSDPPAKAAPPAAGTAAAAPTPTPAPSTGTAAAPEAAQAAGTAPAGELKIPNLPPKVGDKSTEVEDRKMIAKVEPKPGTVVEVTTVEQRQEDKEVMAVDGDVVTKLKVSYPKVAITESAMGKTKDKPTPTLGKSYLVWREGDEFKATLADGGAVSPEELKVLAKGQKRIGRPDVMQQIMAAHAWKQGEVVTMTPAELERLATVVGGEDDGGKLTGMSFALQSSDDKVATFTMTMAMEGTTPKGSMKVSLTGTAKVDRNSGRALEVKAEGPFEGNMGVPITGTMTGTTSYSY